MKMKVELKPQKGLKKVIEYANDNVIKQIKKILIETALVDIESVAKMTLTERKHVVTGRLRASINTKYVGYNEHFGYYDLNGNKFEGTLPVKPQDLKTYFDIFVGTNVTYAPKMERLDPYLKPAFIKAKSKIKQEFQKIKF